MNERPTPETESKLLPWGETDAVLADFARRLERDLAEAREELEDWRNAAQGAENPHPDEKHCPCVPLLHKQLKDARSEIARLKGVKP